MPIPTESGTALAEHNKILRLIASGREGLNELEREVARAWTTNQQLSSAKGDISREVSSLKTCNDLLKQNLERAEALARSTVLAAARPAPVAPPVPVVLTASQARAAALARYKHEMETTPPVPAPPHPPTTLTSPFYLLPPGTSPWYSIHTKIYASPSSTSPISTTAWNTLVAFTNQILLESIDLSLTPRQMPDVLVVLKPYLEHRFPCLRNSKDGWQTIGVLQSRIKLLKGVPGRREREEERKKKEEKKKGKRRAEGPGETGNGEAAADAVEDESGPATRKRARRTLEEEDAYDPARRVRAAGPSPRR